jgi:cysteinyl-tRNA synthetase
VGDLTPLRLYNTRTHAVEAFSPLLDEEVRVYVCGLTPSGQAHLGHARSFLFFDVLRRHLEHRGHRVTYVQNVTDIDDRSIATASEEGTTYRDVVERHYASFKESMRKLGVREPDIEPYATQFVPQIQAMIRALVERGHAYAVDDGVYYAVRSFPGYGLLSRRNLEELEAGARIEIDEFKRDPLDFALWKFAKEGEPSWPFDPYGAGRPGWHIECSAMSRELLDPPGNGFDIHGGGADLIFPHHENEIAQSEPLMRHPPMANFWVHGGLLLFDNRKMSKSLGNFEPLSALLERHDPQAIRLLFLQTGYRKVMNFTQESVSAARVVLERLKKKYRSLKTAGALGSGANGDVCDRVATALDDDMNTAVALAEVLRAESPSLDAFERALTLLGITPDETWLAESPALLPEDFVPRLATLLAGEIEVDGASPEQAVERIIASRRQAREQRDWMKSDRLRDALAACGVRLHDTKEGTTWSVA